LLSNSHLFSVCLLFFPFLLMVNFYHTAFTL
jgi:hypothetical protein